MFYSTSVYLRIFIYICKKILNMIGYFKKSPFPPSSLAILGIVALIIYIFSVNSVWLGDDMRYQYKYTEVNNTLVENYNEFNDTVDTPGDIINSLAVHHKYINGRDVAHFFVHLFCGILGQHAFAICNAIVYVFFICLILRVSYTSIKHPASVLTATLIILLSTQLRVSPAYQINYIWMFTLSLCFLILFFNNTQKYNIFVLILLVLFSLIAGAAHEGLNIGIGGALVIYWILNRKQYTTVQYLMSISFGLGLIWMCLAPGNFIRAEQYENSSLLMNDITFFTYTKAFYLLLIIVVIRIIKYGKKEISDIYKTNAFYWNIWFILVIFNFVLGIKGARQLLGEEIIAIILSIRILKYHKFSKIWLVFFSLLTMSMLYIQGIETIKSRKEWKEITTQYTNSLDSEIYISQYSKPDNIFMTCYSGFPSYIYLLKGKDAESNQRFLNKQLHSIYNTNKPAIKLLPTYLSGKDTFDIGNKIIKCGDGIYLLVQSKKKSKRFYVNRSINIAGIIKKSFAPLKIEFNDVVKETDLWRAQLISENEITILHLSNNDFFIK